MASQKKPVIAKPDPLVIYPMHDGQLRTSQEVDVLIGKQNAVSVATHHAMLGSEYKMRTLVSTLYATQHVLLMRIKDLLDTLEDPSVAHAVSVKEKLDTLMSKLEELQDEFSSHVRNNEHTSRSDYY